jgi:uncharacterized RDD family membrane protein YckC
VAGAPFASWISRVGSYLIDAVIPFGIVIVLSLVTSATGDPSVVGIGLVIRWVGALAFIVWNDGYRQGTTGQSIGKSVLGTRLVSITTGQPVGFGFAIGRQFAHILDGLPFDLGYLWPLWDAQRQTFADKVCSTVVVRAEG